jgi:hypothetical protein
LEFVIDPADDLSAINALLAGDPALEAAGLFGLDLSGASMTATRESGAPLDSWLSFDPGTLSFSGTPPSYYIGAVPVRIDVAGGGRCARHVDHHRSGGGRQLHRRSGRRRRAVGG